MSTYIFTILSSGTDELIPINTLYLDTKYVFYRLNNSLNHPFYISDVGYKVISTSNIILSGDGSYNSGIKGNESFMLEFNGLTTSDKLYYYCTWHQNPCFEISMI